MFAKQRSMTKMLNLEFVVISKPYSRNPKLGLTIAYSTILHTINTTINADDTAVNTDDNNDRYAATINTKATLSGCREDS